MPSQVAFGFSEAFDRNIGWITDWEQQTLRTKRVAIAGMGGVGGVHLLTLARLGIGAFHISDLDAFELANFNRQIGANVRTIGRPKTEVLEEMALAINPELRIKRFDEGISAANVDAFLANVDLFVDGFDFFVLDVRRKVFARCRELGIPALTAAPVGMGVAFLAFTPDGMSFEDYFRFEGEPQLRQYVKFLIGVAPSGVHRSYLVDPTRLDLGNRRAPSTVIGCQFCASEVATAAAKLLLKRGRVKPAPFHHHYDAFTGRLVERRLRFGNAGPLQRLKARAAERAFRALLKRPSPSPRQFPASPIETIIDIARWAPSGDNAQPWRFHIQGKENALVQLTHENNVYEYRNGEPAMLSTGALLENLRIAASALGRTLTWRLERNDPSVAFIHVEARPLPGIEADPLYSAIAIRSVNRRPYRTDRLTDRERLSLEAALGDGARIRWFETLGERFRIAGLNAAATSIRLRIPEAFKIHQRIIDWRNDRSPRGIPARAVGLDRMTLRIMRWAMQSWRRTQAVNAIAGTFPAAFQMDYLPGLCSAAFFTLALAPPSSHKERPVALLEAGQALQRFWLRATARGLAMQPCMAALFFAYYGKHGIAFTTEKAMLNASRKLAARFESAIGSSPDDIVFMGRIGWPKGPPSLIRSTRLAWNDLVAQDGNQDMVDHSAPASVSTSQ